MEKGRIKRVLEDMDGKIKLDPAGRFAVTYSGLGKTVRLWDVHRGGVVHSQEGKKRDIFGLVVTPDGRFAVSTHWDETVQVWDLETGRLADTLTGKTIFVDDSVLYSDGTYSFFGAYENKIQISDLDKKVILRTLEGNSKISTLAVAPDGRCAVSGSYDNPAVQVWDLKIGKPIRELKGHRKNVWDIAITQDGKLAVSGSADETIRIWDLEKSESIHIFKEHGFVVSAVDITPDGRYAVSGSWDKTVRVWNVEKGSLIHTLEGHTDYIEGVVVTRNGEYIVSHCKRQVHMWDMRTGKHIASFVPEEDVAGSGLSPDGNRIVVCDKMGTVHTLTLMNYRHDSKNIHPLKKKVSAELSPPQKKERPKSEDDNLAEPLVLRGHKGDIVAVAITQDARYAASASKKGIIRVWDLDNGEKIFFSSGRGTEIGAIGINYNEFKVFSASLDGSVHVWDLSTGRLIRTIKSKGVAYQAVALDREGRKFVYTQENRYVREWDIESGKELKALSGNIGKIHRITLSAYMRYVAMGSEEKKLLVWDLQCKKEMFRLACPFQPLAVVVSPNGRVVAYGDKSGGIRVWDTHDQKRFLTLNGHSGPVTDLDMDMSGRRVLSVSEDGQAILWDLEFGTILFETKLEKGLTSCSLAGGKNTAIVGGRQGRLYCIRM